MKRFISFCLPLGLLTVILFACEKAQPIDDPTKSNPTAHLVGITKRITYTPTEFVEKLSNSTYASWIGLQDYLKPVLDAFIAERSPEVWTIFAKETGNYAPVNWQIDQINFDYRTVDVKGDSATMSGIICFPNNTLGKQGHSLSSISLVCHTFLNNNTDCPSFKGDITMGRALWNSLVVLPDMQGYGSSKDLGDAMKLSNSCARQVVDCERVAIQIVKSLGMTFDADYCTNVMGYSLGGGVMMGVARYLDQCTDSDKDVFKYSSAFVGGGVFNYFDYVADYVRNKIQKRLYLSNVMPTITYLVKKSDLGLYRVDDFWTPQYTEVLDTIEGRPISPSTFTLYRYDENDENKARKVKFREFFSNSEEALTIFPDDMSTASLVLDPSTPKTMMFKEICDRETPYTDWKPTHKITIYHPENDEQIPYFLALDAFNALKYTNGGGDNVQLKTFQIPTPSSIEVSPHYVGTALAQFKMLVNKDPSVVADTDLLNQLINRIFNAI